MPTYQYHCDACDSDFEVVQSFSDDSVPKCPNRPKTCKSRGTSKIRKVYTAPGITFKGSGFYKNDARAGGSSSSSSSTASSDSSSSSSSDTKKSETKSSDTKKSDAKTSSSKSTAKSDKKS